VAVRLVTPDSTAAEQVRRSRRTSPNLVGSYALLVGQVCLEIAKNAAMGIPAVRKARLRG
jgi:hypothetical protein